MRCNSRPIPLATLLLLALAASACGSQASGQEADKLPATVEKAGPGVNRVTLTADAAKRLGIRMAPVQRAGAGAVIPYSALIYGQAGQPWTYVSPKTDVFMRQRVTVARIAGGRAFLSKGPASGTPVVTQGAAELFGAEFEFEEE
jgi:membrane-bound lytic murein transglycosylase B